MNNDQLIRDYIEVWNERDAAARMELIKSVLTEDSVYSDPDYAGLRGHEALSDAIGVAHGKFGDLRFRLGEVIGEHHGKALFTWKLGEVATGYDAVEFEDGRIRSVIGFFV
ncbi:nuclear transport factor 2 family protein [Actinomadura oligospora]|uniref:nuclear transport factor 2 family protein n=1 Tax=Actinomadura oligospora TaxID=111804 RepID=UPI00047BEDAD|nr:nuclear transport factor 2 family protein [Actinomadura oligospora]